MSEQQEPQEEIILSHVEYMGENGLSDADFTAEQSKQAEVIDAAIEAYNNDPTEENEKALTDASDVLTGMLKESKKAADDAAAEAKSKADAEAKAKADADAQAKADEEAKKQAQADIEAEAKKKKAPKSEKAPAPEGADEYNPLNTIFGGTWY